MIELAYEQAEAAGIVQLNEDEAGPYQAIPQPGASWQPEGHPATQPHEYERGGTAKLLTLFRPTCAGYICYPARNLRIYLFNYLVI